MRTFKIFSALILVLSTLTNSNCETLKTLVFKKYEKQLNTLTKKVEIKDGSGKTVTVDLPPPSYYEREVLCDGEVINLLEQFENDPDAVFSHPRLRHYIGTRAVKDYYTDSVSKRIVDYCLEHDENMLYMRLILAAAARYDSFELIQTLVDKFPFSLAESDEYDLDETSFTRSVVVSGNYHIAQYLIKENYFVDSADVWVDKICTLIYPGNEYPARNFLTYLIIEKQLYNVNNFINGQQPALHRVLSAPHQNQKQAEYKLAIANLLMRLGANPHLVDCYGKTAFDYANQMGLGLQFSF